MKIEKKERTISGIHANFEHDPSMHMRTGVKKQTGVELCQAKVKLE